MKHFKQHFIFAALAAFAVLAASCIQPLNPSASAGGPGRVVLTASLGEAGPARTILPKEPPEFSSYKLTFKKVGETDITVSDASGLAGAGVMQELAVGDWTVVVEASRKFKPTSGTETTYLAAKGEKVVTVAAGVTTPVTVYLTPVPVDTAGANDGIFTYTVTFPEGVTGMLILDKDLDAAAADKTEPLTASMTAPVSIEVAPGYYYLTITLEKNDADGRLTAGASEIVHIYSGLKPEAEYAFTKDDFFIPNTAPKTLVITEITTGDMDGLKQMVAGGMDIQIGIVPAGKTPDPTNIVAGADHAEGHITLGAATIRAELYDLSSAVAARWTDYGTFDVYLALVDAAGSPGAPSGGRAADPPENPSGDFARTYVAARVPFNSAETTVLYRNFAPVPTVPEGPTAEPVRAQGIPEPAVVISWAPVSPEPASYKVYRSDTKGGPSVEIATRNGTDPTFYTDTGSVGGLTAGSDYYYTVYAEDSQGNKDPLSTDPVSAAPLDPSVATSLPTDNTWKIDGEIANPGESDWYQFTAAASTPYVVQLDIGLPYTLAASVSIYTSDGSPLGPFDYTTPQPVFVSSGGTVYVLVEGAITDLDQPSATGTYVIRYYNSADLAPQTAPSYVKAQGIPRPAVLIDWDSVPGATQYNVYHREELDSFSLLTTITSGPPTYLDTAVSPGTTYYYEVKAENGNGEGPSSPQVSAAPPAAATPLTADTWTGWITVGSGDAHWYSFSVSAAGNYNLEGESKNTGTGKPLEASVSAYLDEGTQASQVLGISGDIGSMPSGPHINVLSPGGTVYVLVESHSAGDYRIKYYPQP